MRPPGSRRRSKLQMAVIAVAAALLAVVLPAPGSANAATNYTGSYLSYAQTFYVYGNAGDIPTFLFTQVSPESFPVVVTATDPEGDEQQVCTIPPLSPNGTQCASTGLTASIAGVWTIRYDPNRASPVARFSWSVGAQTSAGTPIPGRVWVETYSQYQSSASNQTYWIATREGYVYRADLRGYSGAGSFIRANGFGLVNAGTCTPTYQSSEGSISGANGVFLPPGVEFSDACGDRYKLFLEAPASDLPASAPSPEGMLWVRPAVVPPSATNLQFENGALTRAGSINFDLAGVNGGYSIQVDTNANGFYTDAVDRIIPYGSPPGAISVPFDGLDGLGEPIGMCQAMNAKVVVDRVGEMHLVLDDVESLGTSSVNNYGIRITGATPGVTGANPKLYWDDTNLIPRNASERPLPYADGRAGVDTTTTVTGAHGWGQWGDQRSIENWTYYQAQAGAEAAVPAPCGPELSIDKIADLQDTNGNGVGDLGETIEYSFLVRNTGNVAVAGVTVDDDLVTGITPASVDLPVSGEQLFTSDPVEVTEAIMSDGGVANTALARGTDPLGSTVESNDDTEFVPTAERQPGLTLTKAGDLDDADSNGVADLGETIAYTFVVENTGNVTLENVTVTDPRVTGVAPASVTLGPGDSQTFTADPYVVVQADLNTGVVHNTAFATGTSALGTVESNRDIVEIPTPTPDPELTLEKSAEITVDLNGDGLADVGDTITYTFLAQNIGTVDLTSVSILDDRVASVTPADADIPANGDATYTATYLVQQSDIDAGEIVNTATAAGVYGVTEVTSAPDTAVVATPQRAPALTLVKNGLLQDTNGNGAADVGETIDYTFVVENSGNTTLEGVEVIDDRVTAITPASTTLSPGGDATFTATPYAVTQADVDSGEVLNTAFARGHIPGGAEVFSGVDTHIQPVAPAAAAITIDKIGTLDDANGNDTADAGEQILFVFDVRNTGNITLTDVSVVDDRIAALIPASIDFLSPGVTYRFTASQYTVTPADVAAGEVVNVAHAVGSSASGAAVESAADTVVIAAELPASPGALGATGADPKPLLAGGLVLLIGGAIVLLARRKLQAVPALANARSDDAGETP